MELQPIGRFMERYVTYVYIYTHTRVYQNLNALACSFALEYILYGGLKHASSSHHVLPYQSIYTTTDLRDEFSIGDRFSKVEHKINHVQSNTKFFLEILNHQKSNKLEWIIVVLIATEIVLSCIDLHHQLFVSAVRTV